MNHTFRTAVGAIVILCIALAGQGLSDEKPTNPQATETKKRAARVGDSEERLEQLRRRHQEASATFSKTKDYGGPYRESIASAHELLSALLIYWKALPEGSPEAETAEKEIKTVFKDLAGGRGTERYNLAKSFIARATWPLLVDSNLTQKQAKFVMELTKPQMAVRMNDKKARRGKWTDPLGWDVQAAYALSLIRSGANKQALNEISVLRDKVSQNRARKPNGTLDYGPEAGPGRYRNYLDYLQLCEALHALQAAVSNDREGAGKHLGNARKLRKDLSPEATPLVAEVMRRVELNKD